jgi:hypothetical protein
MQRKTIGLNLNDYFVSQNNLVDEWVDVDDFVKLVYATAQVITDWCGEV